jgi:hypothetical protein
MNKFNDVNNKFLEIYMLCSLDPFHPLQNNCRYSDIYNYEYYNNY